MRKITKRQIEVLEFIKAYIADKGYAPSNKDIADHFGFASLNAAYEHLVALQKKGYIDITENVARSIRIKEKK